MSFHDSPMARFLRESFCEQFGSTVGNRMMDTPERFSGRHLIEMEAQAAAAFEERFRAACLEALAEQEPKHDA